MFARGKLQQRPKTGREEKEKKTENDDLSENHRNHGNTNNHKVGTAVQGRLTLIDVLCRD